MMYYDKIIIGAGLYGLYAALHCGRKRENILVLECDEKAFSRATYINQARVHMGYHYPRSLSTAMKSAGYFERFIKDYSFCINKEFAQIYATSDKFSWTDAIQFKKFCNAAGIPCEELNPEQFFKKGACDGAFMTKEYTYDAMLLKEYFLEEISKLKNISVRYGVAIMDICEDHGLYLIREHEKIYTTPFLLNVTYAGVNQILAMLRLEQLKIKYELCEIILCDCNEALKNTGFTVMDGPFFSIMPFGKTGYHSLTAVTFTPHETCYDKVPAFECQQRSSGYCNARHLGNCNVCSAKPETAFPYMSNLAKKYIKNEFRFQYAQSMFSMKPILMNSEIDDSRPTVIRKYTTNPTLISVLSGKINTVFDLDEVLDHE